MTDEKALEDAARNFLLGPQLESRPSIKKKGDPLDVALGLGMGTQARVGFKGALAEDRDMKPKLIKHHYLKHQQRVRV